MSEIVKKIQKEILKFKPDFIFHLAARLLLKNRMKIQSKLGKAMLLELLIF